MKRTLCWILVISMVLGLIAGLAVSVSAEETTAVREAAVTGLKAPVFGESFSSEDFSVPADAAYEVSAVWEYDPGNGETVQVASGTYGYKSYDLYITITPKEGAVLQLGYGMGMPTVNGVKFDEILWEEGAGYILEGWETDRHWYEEAEDRFTMHFQAVVKPEKDWVWDVYIGGLPEHITAGEAAPVVTTIVREENNAAVVTSALWLTSGKQPLTGNFETGKIYYLEVKLKTLDGYAFNDPYIYGGPETESVSVSENGLEAVAYIRYSLLPVVDRVDLTLTEPADGAAVGSVTLPEEVNYKFYTYADFIGYEWKVENDWYAVPTQFESGKVYELRLELAVAQGYEFAEDVDIYVNGKLIKDVSGGGQVLDTTLRYSLKKQIDRVDVTIPEYKLGDVPKDADVVLPENADYILNALYVYSRLHDTDYTEGLQKDRYRFEINLIPKDGCEFAEDLKFFINGKETTKGYSGNTYAMPYYEISFCDKITSVAFPALPNLQVGDVLGDEGPYYPGFVAPEGANYYIGYEWMQADTDNTGLIEFEGTVQAKGQYWLMYGAFPNEGYEFAENVTVTVDGVATEMMMADAEDLIGVKQYVFGLQIIDKVELITNPYAVGGQIGQITIPEDANYEIVQWEWGVSPDGTINGVGSAEGDVFEEGKYYLVGAALVPKDGYVFAQDLVITVNGVAANLSISQRDEEMLTTNGTIAMAFHCLNKEAAPPAGDNPPTGSNAAALVIALAVLSAAGLAIVGKKA